MVLRSQNFEKFWKTLKLKIWHIKDDPYIVPNIYTNAHSKTEVKVDGS